MAYDRRKELSGAFSSEDKWQTVLASLRNASSCVEHLQVQHNKTQHNILVAAALFFNTSVTHIEWGDLDSVGACCLSKVLSANGSIKVLKVHGWTKPEEAVPELLTGLRASRHLEFFELSWAGQECLLAAAAAVRAPGSVLRCLTITHSALHPGMASCLAKAYALGSGALQEISFCDCTLVGDALQLLLEAFEAHSGVVKLQIDSCGVTGDHLSTLMQCPLLCQRLRNLSLPNNNIGNIGLGWISKSFGAGCALASLDLQATCLNDGCAAELATLLHNCSNLQELGLGENELADATVDALAAVVSRHPSLSELDLSLNKYGGLKSLGQFVSGTSPLKVLKLCKNWRLGDEGAAALAEQLQSNWNLTALHLSESGIKCDGAKALAAAIKEHPSLTALHLDGCRIGDSGAVELLNAVRSNLNIRCWSMDNNRIRDKMNKKMVTDFAAAVSRRTDESVYKRRCLQMQHSAHSVHSSPSSAPASPTHYSPTSPHSPPQTPSSLHTPDHAHSAPNLDLEALRTPLPPFMQGTELFFLSPYPSPIRPDEPDGDPRISSNGVVSTDNISFKNMLGLWKNVATSMSSANSSPERDSDGRGDAAWAEAAPRSMFQGVSNSLRKIDSFGRWVSSGSKNLNSVESLTGWSSFLTGSRSRAGSVAANQPLPETRTNDEGFGSSEEECKMDETEGGISFNAKGKSTPESCESPRYIGSSYLARTAGHVGSFKFFEYLRTSSEAGSTPRFRNRSPLASPVVSPNRTALRLTEVLE